MEQHGDSITLSIVVPVHSGEEYLAELIAHIDKLKNDWLDMGLDLLVTEVIFVLDAPVDCSQQILQNLAGEHSWIRLVELSRNYGQHSATIAGILYSSGDWVVTIDEDLQHHPEQIEKLLMAASLQGGDVVYAQPQSFVHGGGYRDRLSRMVKYLVAKISGNQFVLSFNSFRLIRGDIARAASSICAQYTYFDIALTWFTERIVTTDMDLSDHRYNDKKRSGYSFKSLVGHAKRLILTSGFQTLTFTTSLSFVALLSSVGYGVLVLYSRFFTEQMIEVEGWASLMIVILAFGGAAIFILGLLVELLHMGMLQLQGKPSFFVVNRSSDPKLSLEIKKLHR